MIGQMQEIVTEKTQALAEQVQKLRKESAETVREAVAGSAESLKAMKSPVRLFARSGIKVTAVSQTAVQSLIELQSDVITSALTQIGLIKLANQLQSSLTLGSIVHVIAMALSETFGFREASVYLREPGGEFAVEHPDERRARHEPAAGAAAVAGRGGRG